MASGPYTNARVERYAVRTNNPIGGAMRGFGAPQVCLAYEGQMDTLADQLGDAEKQPKLKGKAFKLGAKLAV